MLSSTFQIRLNFYWLTLNNLTAFQGNITRMTLRKLHPPIHLLRAFVMTARHSSISRAAEALHLTQSAVSKQILELEGSLGVSLFERVRKRLVLTPAGVGLEWPSMTVSEMAVALRNSDCPMIG